MSTKKTVKPHDTKTLARVLEEKINHRTVELAVVGLGYVGLPLALSFAKKGVKVHGFDLSTEKVKSLNARKSYILDIPDHELKSVPKELFTATSDPAVLGKADVVFICVPTPFTRAKAPDLHYVQSATRSILAHQRPGQLIILESTTYPGTTEEQVQPILEEKGLKAGRDFFLAFSPERVDPGNTKYGIENTPKVIGGLTPNCNRLACGLYRLVVDQAQVVPVNSLKVAEMTKLLENTFRSVNIALINELTFLCDRMDINIWEVIGAAASKPFGYMPFYPGPGVGGHCIPVDPYYLSWKAREFDFWTKFIELSAETNQMMPIFVMNKLTRLMNNHGKALKGSKILALGATFKKNVNDARNSPAVRILDLMLEAGVKVQYHDPYVSVLNHAHGIEPEELSVALKRTPVTPKAIKEADCVVLLVDHDDYDLPMILQNAKAILDTRNAFAKVRGAKKKVTVL